MPKRSLNLAGSANRTSLSGGTRTTTLPSRLAAATSWSHDCDAPSAIDAVHINTSTAHSFKASAHNPFMTFPFVCLLFCFPPVFTPELRSPPYDQKSSFDARLKCSDFNRLIGVACREFQAITSRYIPGAFAT
jgi:hypothetical protein